MIVMLFYGLGFNVARGMSSGGFSLGSCATRAAGIILLDFFRCNRFFGEVHNLKNMKFPSFYTVLLCAGLTATPLRLSGQAASPAAAEPLGPRIAFATNEFHFGQVIAGTLVDYTFIASNAGDQTLAIFSTSASCPCTTVEDWDREVEPGKTGKIPIQFDSSDFRGDVAKTITVNSNDKLAPEQTLAIRGMVRRGIQFTPKLAYINIVPDAPSASTNVVRLSNQSEESVTLSDPTSDNTSFKAELKTIAPGREFDVTVTAAPPLAVGSTTGTVSIRTSLAYMPVINIPTIAMLHPAVNVTPPQIILPPRIDDWTTNIVTITANGTNVLALSDATVSDERASVELNETTPGHVFQLAVIFRPGFVVATGRQAQLSVKSNNAECPVIVVPVRQARRQPAPSLPRP
jgi:hypothetical protein